ncbi:MAG: MFS transporter [Gemmatimonadota bacterium]
MIPVGAAPSGSTIESAPTSPLRWRVTGALLVVTLINWLDRSAMSLALPRIARERGWTIEEIGANGAKLISGFFLSYGLASILLSPIAERFGPRRALALSVVAFSLFTALNAPFGSTVSALVALRLLLGIAESVHFPMAGAIVSRWFPLTERSRANGMWLFGPQLAIIAGPFLMVPLIEHFGWRPMFLMLGAVGLVVGLPVLLRYVHDDGPLSRTPLGQSQVPLIAVFRQPDYWLALIAGSLSNVIVYGLVTWLPTYLMDGRHVAFANLAGPTSAPYWLGVLGIPFWAVAGDATGKRTLFASIGCGIAAVATYVGAHAASLTVTIVLLSAAIFFQKAYQTSEYALVQRILPPERVGAATGLYNGLAVIVGGAGGTWLVGKVVEITRSYEAGLMVVVVAGLANVVVLGILAARIRY